MVQMIVVKLAPADHVLRETTSNLALEIIFINLLHVIQVHLFSLIRKIWTESWFLSRLLLYVQNASHDID
jgi:hypothetical protein